MRRSQRRSRGSASRRSVERGGRAARTPPPPIPPVASRHGPTPRVLRVRPGAGPPSASPAPAPRRLPAVAAAGRVHPGAAVGRAPVDAGGLEWLVGEATSLRDAAAQPLALTAAPAGDPAPPLRPAAASAARPEPRASAQPRRVRAAPRPAAAPDATFPAASVSPLAALERSAPVASAGAAERAHLPAAERGLAALVRAWDSAHGLADEAESAPAPETAPPGRADGRQEPPTFDERGVVPRRR